MQKLRMKKIVSSFLPLVLLVTLMQVIPVIYPRLSSQQASGLTPVACTSTASANTGEGISNACDGNLSTKYLGLTGTSELRLDVGTSIILGSVTFSAGNDDATYRNRMVADLTIKGCAAADTAVSSCVDIQTVSWTQTQLDSVGNSGTYPIQVINSTTAYRYYYLTTVTYGEKFWVSPDAPCAGLVGSTNCVQYTEVILETALSGSSSSSLRVQFKDSTGSGSPAVYRAMSLNLTTPVNLQVEWINVTKGGVLTLPPRNIASNEAILTSWTNSNCVLSTNIYRQNCPALGDIMEARIVLNPD